MSTTSLSRDITGVLARIGEGETTAVDELLPLVYGQLRRIAQKKMAFERRGHTLEATALVHETYIKLLGRSGASWANRAHFFGSAAEAMRQILIDHARKKTRRKPSTEQQRELANVLQIATEQTAEEILALNDVLEGIKKQDPRMHEVIMLRCFAGLSVQDTAEALNVSARTVKREWRCARARLFSELYTSSGR